MVNVESVLKISFMSHKGLMGSFTYVCGITIYTIRSHKDVCFVFILYEKFCVFHFIVYETAQKKED